MKGRGGANLATRPFMVTVGRGVSPNAQRKTSFPRQTRLYFRGMRYPVVSPQGFRMAGKVQFGGALHGAGPNVRSFRQKTMRKDSKPAITSLPVPLEVI